MSPSDTKVFFNNVSFLKSAGVPKMMNALEASGFDMEAFLTMHRKNIEFLVAANQAALENLQSFGQHQIECMRLYFGQTAALMNAVPASPAMYPPALQGKMLRNAKKPKGNRLETVAE